MDNTNISTVRETMQEMVQETKQESARSTYLGRLENIDYRRLTRNPKYSISKTRANMRRLDGAEYVALAHRPKRHNYYVEHPEAVETLLAGPIEECLAKEYTAQCTIFDNGTPTAMADTDTDDIGVDVIRPRFC